MANGEAHPRRALPQRHRERHQDRSLHVVRARNRDCQLVPRRREVFVGMEGNSQLI